MAKGTLIAAMRIARVAEDEFHDWYDTEHLPERQRVPGFQLPSPQAGGLLLNAMNIAPELEAEFNEWYDKEHIPALAAVPGVLGARRFRGTSGNRKYVA